MYNVYAQKKTQSDGTIINAQKKRRKTSKIQPHLTPRHSERRKNVFRVRRPRFSFVKFRERFVIIFHLEAKKEIYKKTEREREKKNKTLFHAELGIMQQRLMDESRNRSVVVTPVREENNKKGIEEMTQPAQLTYTHTHTHTRMNE